MAVSNQSKNQHLLWRAGFGPMAENAANLHKLSQKDLWDLLVKTSEKKSKKIEVANNLVDGLFKGIGDVVKMEEAANAREKRQQMRKQSREDLKNLNIFWLEEMINSEAQLREKMAFFWHGHFACRVINSFFQQELLHIVRENALGNFGDLLMAVSKSPSMLNFLNNQQNRKQHPNENFAREVMELFTMGRGNYTEKDIQEAARAFTGWSFNLNGEFVFRKNIHDDKLKTVLGKTGNFEGEDIIKLLLEQKQTAVYITRKLYKFFVNETPDEKNVQWLAERFFKNKYEIKPLLEDIFTSSWFYEDKNIGNKIKSPIELLAGIRRFLPMEMENDQSQLLFQKLLGQILFYPPNVAGWPGGKAWIDSSSLMIRLRMPQVFAVNELLDIKPKDDDDVMMGQMTDAAAKKKIAQLAKGVGNATIDWTLVTKIFESVPRENLLERISDALLQTKGKIKNETLGKFINQQSRDLFVKSAVVYLMSTPEYQLC